YHGWVIISPPKKPWLPKSRSIHKCNSHPINHPHVVKVSVRSSAASTAPTILAGSNIFWILQGIYSSYDSCRIDLLYHLQSNSHKLNHSHFISERSDRPQFSDVLPSDWNQVLKITQCKFVGNAERS